MKEWDSMGISEDWSKSRRPPKKLTVVSFCVFLMKAVGFFSRRQSSSVTLQNNSWYAFLLKTDDLAGNALENYVRRYP